jgi:hypothetical protein
VKPFIESEGQDFLAGDVREAIAIRYLGEEAGRAFVRSLEDQDTVLFTIRPDRWITADFSDEL